MNDELFEINTGSNRAKNKQNYDLEDDNNFRSSQFKAFDDHDQLMNSPDTMRPSITTDNPLKQSLNSNNYLSDRKFQQEVNVDYINEDHDEEEEKKENAHQKRKKKVMVTKHMVKEAELLGLSLKEYLHLVDKESRNKNNDDKRIISQKSIDHYRKQQEKYKKRRQQDRSSIMAASTLKEEQDSEFIKMQKLIEEQIRQNNIKKSKEKNKRGSAKKKATFDELKLEEDHQREKNVLSEFQRPQEEKRLKLRFNQSLIFGFIVTIFLFTLMSLILEIAFYGMTVCGDAKPAKLPRTAQKIQPSYVSAIENPFFIYLGLFLTIALLAYSSYCFVFDIRDKEGNFIKTRFLRKYLLAMFLFGSIPAYTLPVTTYDYNLCDSRNYIFRNGNFPVYFQRFISIFMFILFVTSVSLKILYISKTSSVDVINIDVLKKQQSLNKNGALQQIQEVPTVAQNEKSNMEGTFKTSNTVMMTFDQMMRTSHINDITTAQDTAIVGKRVSGPPVQAKASTLNKGMRLLSQIIRILEYFIYLMSGVLNVISIVICLGNYISGTQKAVPFLVIFMYTYGLLAVMCLFQRRLVKILSNGDKFIHFSWDLDKITNRKLEKNDQKNL